MKKRSRIQKATRKLVAGETDDRICEEKEKKLPGSRGRPRKTTSVNSSCNVNSLKDAKATDGMQKPTEVKFRSSGTWLETISVFFISFIMHHSWLIVKSDLNWPSSATNWLSKLKLVFYCSNRQTQHRHLPPLPWKVLPTQLAARLSVAAGCCWGGVGCRGPVTPPFVPHIPRWLPAAGWGAIGPGPAAIWVCLQEMPHQVLQVPQHPDKVSAEGQPPASWEREP